MLKKLMRHSVFGTGLMLIALNTVGCNATREPQTIIEPTYSYVRAGHTLETTQASVSLRSVHVASSINRISKLPPLPPAPGFETYVLVPNVELRAE